MAKKDTLMAEAAVAEADVEPTVQIFIPLADDENSGINVDQTETVIINGEVTRIKRGEYVNVKIPVFLQLKNKYPRL